ncbi:MAG: response regulator [Leptospiraceae bacterium]|nr:response regulator [Leptospiraceae bacterium]
MEKKLIIGIVENDSHYRDFLKEKFSDFYEFILWSSGEECYHDDRVKDLDLLLLDIGLPHMSGIELLRILIPKYPQLKILVLSGINSDEIIFDALKFGACGYIWKNELNNLPESIQIIMDGGSFMSPAISVRVLRYFRAKVEPENQVILTNRERQVLELISSGIKISKLSEQLDISLGTARKHIHNIYNKLQVSDRVSLMIKANEMGFL